MYTKQRSRFVEIQLEMSNYIGKRKHGSQLSRYESDLIWKRLHDVKQWRISEYALGRVESRGIRATYKDLVSVIDNGEIIEYKIDYNEKNNRCEERVVLRATAIVNDEYNLHVVYSLSKKMIVTVWMNHLTDRHFTLDWSLYDASMKVFEEV